MKNVLILFFCLCFGNFYCQESFIEAIKIEPNSFLNQDFIGKDSYGNFWYEKDNLILKKNATSNFQYQNISLGKIKKIDLLNPLKTLVFYEDFNTIILLDNQLNEVQKINFSELNTSNQTPILTAATGICGQNKLWIYNALDQQIGLFDWKTQLYKTVSNPLKNGITYYQNDFNNFSWIDRYNHFYTCTIYGEIFSNGTVEPFDKIKIIDSNSILYSIENNLYYRNIKANLIYKIEIVEKSFEKFYYSDQILTIFTEKEITNYKIILP